MKTPHDLAVELEKWADARDKINVRKEKSRAARLSTADGRFDDPPRLLDSTALRDAAQYLRLIPDVISKHDSPSTNPGVCPCDCDHLISCVRCGYTMKDGHLPTLGVRVADSPTDVGG